MRDHLELEAVVDSCEEGVARGSAALAYGRNGRER
jgi:hypothetical protein